MLHSLGPPYLGCVIRAGYENKVYKVHQIIRPPFV